MSDTKISEFPNATYVFGDERVALADVDQHATIGQIQLGDSTPGFASRLARFGTGELGSAVVSTGVVLTDDAYYDNLTLVAGGYIATMGFRLYVKNVLDLTACDSHAIRFHANPHGANASGSTGGAGGGATADGSVGGAGGAGTNGATGGTGNGAQSSAGTSITGNGGRGGAIANNNGGKGGNGNGTTGATGRTSPTVSNRLPIDRVFVDLLRGGTLLRGGSSGVGGGAGGGDTVNSGGGGGGGGTGGGVVAVFARVIAKSALTPAHAISAEGGNGGLGGTPLAGNCGGGGGGNGGGGGWVYLCYEALIGPKVIALLDASGGDGGRGGDGVGTGLGGQGGQGGGGGQIDALCTLDGTALAYDRTLASPSNASTPATITGSDGSAGIVCLLSL